MSTTSAQGLTTQQVKDLVARGEVNVAPQSLTRPIPRIIRDHVVTLFNILNLILFLLVVSVGEYKNGLFFLIAIANTVIGAFQDIRAKLTIDKLSVITETHAMVIRDGKKQSIPQEEVALGDTLLLSLGNQVCADSIVIESHNLEVDESLLTGESYPVVKNRDDEVFSGSFVIAGNAVVRVTAVGQNSYAQSISAVSGYEKKSNSQLMRIVNFIIRTLAIVLLPLSLMLFARTYFNTGDYSGSILAMVAAAVGMVPEGLMLLTGIAFAVGAYNLVKHRTLTQSMPSIETLARVDVLCLDKTGTITDGTLSVEDIAYLTDETQTTDEALMQFAAVMSEDNETARALRERFSGYGTWSMTDSVAFSSARKWSGFAFEGHGSYVMGAPEFVLPDRSAHIRDEIADYAARGLRVLVFARSHNPFEGSNLPSGLYPLALVVLADNIRSSAKATFGFFEDQGVQIKVISGDDPQTVSTIADMAGIDGARHYIDMSRVRDDQPLDDLVTTYTVFGRTSPEQKQRMVQALQRDGRIVGMVGDGVNDTMSLREADVSVAMASGSEAARTVADFVLVDSDFKAMTDVVKEGRRVVNNIEKVASLYIVKTIYTVILTLIFVFLPYEYPFRPIQLTLINFFMIGVPSFFLTFTPDYSQMHDWFAHKLIRDAVPAAILVVANVVVIQVLGNLLGLSEEQLSTLSVLMNGIISLLLLIRISQPYTRLKLLMNVVMITGFFIGFVFLHDFFELVPIFNTTLLIWVPLALISYLLYEELTKLMVWAEKLWLRIRGKTYTAPEQG